MFEKQFPLFFISACAVLVGCVSEGLAQRSPPDLKSLLTNTKHKWCSNTQVFFPGQPNYANLTTQRWSSYEAPSYLASVKPACVRDVETIVSTLKYVLTIGYWKQY